MVVKCVQLMADNDGNICWCRAEIALVGIEQTPFATELFGQNVRLCSFSLM